MCKSISTCTWMCMSGDVFMCRGLVRRMIWFLCQIHTSNVQEAHSLDVLQTRLHHLSITSDSKHSGKVIFLSNHTYFGAVVA